MEQQRPVKVEFDPASWKRLWLPRQWRRSLVHAGTAERDSSDGCQRVAAPGCHPLSKIRQLRAQWLVNAGFEPATVGFELAESHNGPCRPLPFAALPSTFTLPPWWSVSNSPPCGPSGRRSEHSEGGCAAADSAGSAADRHLANPHHFGTTRRREPRPARVTAPIDVGSAARTTLATSPRRRRPPGRGRSLRQLPTALPSWSRTRR